MEKVIKCFDCGDMVSRNDISECNHCGEDFCDSCFSGESCGNCDDHFCSESCLDRHNGEYHNDNDDDDNNRSDTTIIVRPYSSAKIFRSDNEGKEIRSKRIYGVEIEAYYPDREAGNAVQDELPRGVGVTTDGSINHRNGFEIQTPKLAGTKGELIAPHKLFWLNEDGTLGEREMLIGKKQETRYWDTNALGFLGGYAGSGTKLSGLGYDAYENDDDVYDIVDDEDYQVLKDERNDVQKMMRRALVESNYEKEESLKAELNFLNYKMELYENEKRYNKL